MPSAPSAPLSLSDAREPTPEAPAPTSELLPVEYSGPFKACKDVLVRAFEREYLIRLLRHTRGNIAWAAREAELDRKYLYSLLHKYGLARDNGD